MRILVIDDEAAIRDTLGQTLKRLNHEVVSCQDGSSGVLEAEKGVFDLVFLDVKMTGMDGLEVLKQLKVIDPDITVVMITGYPSVDSVLNAFRLGAYDYLAKPFLSQEVRLVLERADYRRRLRFENEQLRRELKAVKGDSFVVSMSPAMKEVNALIEKVAESDSNVLLTGESGTGKEVAARAINALSNRSARELVAVDCSTLAESVLESELFGHVKGAYTGASATRRGLLELADGGTLFLDEIGNLTLRTQAKLLRVLQEGEIKPVGGDTVKKINVRFIAATNSDLRKMVAGGTFREDLYYRLAVFPIELPPLRQRLDDLPSLVRHFVAKYSTKAHKRIDSITPEFMTALTTHSFPGNIRELENIIQRAIIVEDTRDLRHTSLPPYLLKERVPEKTLFPTLDEFERMHIELILTFCNGHKGEAATILGIDRKTLYRKLVKYGLE